MECIKAFPFNMGGKQIKSILLTVFVILSNCAASEKTQPDSFGLEQFSVTTVAVI